MFDKALSELKVLAVEINCQFWEFIEVRNNRLLLDFFWTFKNPSEPLNLKCNVLKSSGLSLSLICFAHMCPYHMKTFCSRLRQREAEVVF